MKYGVKDFDDETASQAIVDANEDEDVLLVGDNRVNELEKLSAGEIAELFDYQNRDLQPDDDDEEVDGVDDPMDDPATSESTMDQSRTITSATVAATTETATVTGTMLPPTSETARSQT